MKTAATKLLMGLSALVLLACDPEPPIVGTNIAGQGSTLARFTIEGDNLYIIDNNALRRFDITDRRQPVEGERIEVDFQVESIFSYGNNLFMSNETELNIYSLANPNAPSRVGTYEGINACTPVAFQGNYAFVGRRQGDACGWVTESTLAVLDISDIGNPVEVQSYSGFNRISSPYQLVVDGEALYLCEGQNGFRVFQSTDPTDLLQTGYNRTFEAFDVIPNGNTAIIKANDGLYQYDISNPLNIRELSVIPLN